MNTEPTPPAPCNDVQTTCDAPVLGEAQLATMQGFATTWAKMGGRAVGAELAAQLLGDALVSHRALTARLRAAEERERILLTEIGRYLVCVPSLGDDHPLVRAFAHSQGALCQQELQVNREGDEG